MGSEPVVIHPQSTYNSQRHTGLGRHMEVTAMIMTTTPTIEGKTISEYCGIVTGEAILGANVFRDFFASIAHSALRADFKTSPLD